MMHAFQPLRTLARSLARAMRASDRWAVRRCADASGNNTNDVRAPREFERGGVPGSADLDTAINTKKICETIGGTRLAARRDGSARPGLAYAKGRFVKRRRPLGEEGDAAGTEKSASGRTVAKLIKVTSGKSIRNLRCAKYQVRSPRARPRMLFQTAAARKRNGAMTATQCVEDHTDLTFLIRRGH